MVLFLLLVIAAIVLGILGAVIKGLFFLVIVGPVVFVLAFVVLGFWLRSRRRRTPVRWGRCRGSVVPSLPGR
jgi:hypothetical protein